jgi:hypothetical protein
MLSSSGSQLDVETPTIIGSLSASYFIVRTCLAWKQSRLDIAEHMFAKATPNFNSLDTTTGEELAEVLFEIGNELLPQADIETALLWLKRSYDVISRHNSLRLSSEVVDLRFHILQRYSEFDYSVEVSCTTFESDQIHDGPFCITIFSRERPILDGQLFQLNPSICVSLGKEF